MITPRGFVHQTVLVYVYVLRREKIECVRSWFIRFSLDVYIQYKASVKHIQQCSW